MKTKISLFSVFLLIALLATVGTATAANSSRAFIARLDGAGGTESEAWGHAVFNLSRGGTELRYRLIVHQLDDVTMAHIHWAPSGRPVVWLYPDGPPPTLIEGRVDGVVATGVITADDLINDLAGQTLEDLLYEMETGNTFVNVHTDAFPGGEIRGTVYPLNP
jgi:hypothetical protein